MMLMAGVLGAAPATFAAKPEIETVETDNVFVDEAPCGFPLQSRFTGTIRFFVFRDKNGNVKRQLNVFHQQATYTNLDTGASVSSPVIGPDITYFEQDGSTRVAVIGIINRIVIPGQGAVVLEAGRIVIFFPAGGGEPEVIFESGPTRFLFPVLCELLG
jgi:hypothetical protein